MSGSASALPVQVLSFEQEVVVLCLGWLSSAFSIAGSSCILYLLYRRSGGVRHWPTQSLDCLGRLLLGMSTCDMLHSFGLLWQGLLLPADTSPRHFPFGNDRTCTLLGFGIQLGFSVAFYNGMLSFYYLCTVRHGLTPRQIATRYERYMHSVAIGLPVLTALLGVYLDAFHESFAGPMCWIADFPAGCDGNPELPCKSFLLGYLIAGAPVGIIFLCIVTNMIRIYRHVRASCHGVPDGPLILPNNKFPNEFIKWRLRPIFMSACFA